jgi:hypothetical protein
MRKQTAILILDHDEWIFIADDDEPERTRKDFETAIKQLVQEGWKIVQGPAPVRSENEKLDARNERDYRLRRSIQ